MNSVLVHYTAVLAVAWMLVVWLLAVYLKGRNR